MDEDFERWLRETAPEVSPTDDHRKQLKLMYRIKLLELKLRQTHRRQTLNLAVVVLFMLGFTTLVRISAVRIFDWYRVRRISSSRRLLRTW